MRPDLAILGILVASYIIARVMRETDTEGELSPLEPPEHGADGLSAVAPSSSVHLYDQEAERVYSALMDEVRDRVST